MAQGADLFTLAGGYTARPFAEMKAAGEVCAVLEKCGRGMTRKCYAEQTAFPESLLKDLGRAESRGGHQSSCGRGGAGGAVARGAGRFRRCARRLHQSEGGQGRLGDIAQKPLVALINDGIVPYLNIVAAMAENIKRTNDIVARRRAGKKAE